MSTTNPNKILDEDNLISSEKVTMPSNENTDEFADMQKEEVIKTLLHLQRQCSLLEQSKKNLETQVENLEKTSHEQILKCKNLEKDRSFLRDNIRKVSTNWFERKAKLSEGEEHKNEISAVVDSVTEYNNKEEYSSSDSDIQKDKWQKYVWSEMKYKNDQLDLSERRIAELSNRLKDYENVINDQEIIIHGMKDQLDTYFSDNQNMAKQLVGLHSLFKELEDINNKEVKVPVSAESPVPTSHLLPSADEFKAMAGSISKTYLKLKELIYEKKSLVTEIERLQTLNVELQRRVSQQETRLVSVTDALQTTWLLVSDLKDEHARIHDDESILRYELKEKRNILNRLREELECSREQWHIIRQKNSESEQEWQNLKQELDERRKQNLNKQDGDEVEGGVEAAALDTHSPKEYTFEPPIDLLVDMGIEYGVIDADDEETTTAMAVLTGEDVHSQRLHNLEDQCYHLYQKLMTSTSRSLTLASRLTSLHQHYASSDEDDEDDDELEDDDEEFYEDDDVDLPGNTNLGMDVTPDSDSNDTAYVSEADGGDTASASGNQIERNISTDGPLSKEELELPDEDSCDFLSKRLINILPQKIEILMRENKKLEDKLLSQQEDKAKMESSYCVAQESERRQRSILEEQLKHLGKVVDELKLERNGKIAEMEEKLQRKIEEVDKDVAQQKLLEQEKQELKEQLEALQEEAQNRGQLLQVNSELLKNAEDRANTAGTNVLAIQKKMELVQDELKILKETQQR